MLQTAREHYRNQQQIQARGIAAARRARRRSLIDAAATVAAFQVLAAQEAAQAVELMLEEQQIDAPAVAAVATTALAGTASDGRGLASLLDQAKTDYQFGLMVATQLKDIGRMGAGTAMAARPAVGGYTRMLNPPSCSRCVVLAGRFYRWNIGFERHPGCDCVHVPTSSRGAAESEGLIQSPGDYFDSLPSAEQLARDYPELTVQMRRDLGLYSQEDIFTKAGAQAIRDGADINQVVNARRGMRTAQVYGRQAVITTEGTTRRGVAYRSLTRGRDTDIRVPGERYARARGPRLMPESIYANATSREDAIRLLRAHGYLT